MGAPFAMKGLMGNPVSNPKYWKPSTFGGELGFNIAKTTTLKDLFCRNMKSCDYIDFKVPSEIAI